MQQQRSACNRLDSESSSNGCPAFPERYERSGLISAEVRAACRDYLNHRLSLLGRPKPATCHRLETIVTELLLNIVMHSPCKTWLPSGDVGAYGSIEIAEIASGRYRVATRGFVAPDAVDRLAETISKLKKLSPSELDEKQVEVLRQTSGVEPLADEPPGSGLGLLVVARTATELADPVFEESADQRRIVRIVSIIADEAA